MKQQFGGMLDADALVKGMGAAAESFGTESLQSRTTHCHCVGNLLDRERQVHIGLQKIQQQLLLRGASSSALVRDAEQLQTIGVEQIYQLQFNGFRQQQRRRLEEPAERGGKLMA